MAFTAFAVAVVGSSVANIAATNAQNRAQKKTARIERAQAQRENIRNTRRAVQARRRQEADIIAASQSQNQGANSAVTGATGALASQTGSNIGFANTALASSNLQSLTLQRGASRAASLGNIAQGFDAVGGVSIALAKRNANKKTP